MGAEVEHCIGLPDFFQIGVVGRKSVMRAGAARIEKTHGVTLVAEGGLYADKDVAEVSAEHQQVLPITVQIAGWFSPVLLKPF